LHKLIITAALIGSAPMRDKNPHVPYTPKEIAEEGIRCWRAGAQVVHVHVRDPKTGALAFEKELFGEVVERLRAETDLIINLTTSGFSNVAGSVNEARLMPMQLKPDICSLDVGTMNFRGKVFLNPDDWGIEAATRMQEAGIKPEIEVFELGHISQAKDIIQRGLVNDPPYFQICMGVKWGAPASLDTLIAMTSQLPQGCQWSALATGPHQLPLTTHAMLMGGHVRVGFEDNLYLARGVKAKSNADFVERAVKLAGILQREVASVEEARGILGLKSAE
jgi:3-keto-5-aminohexanoate cleavage enzyme